MAEGKRINWENAVTIVSVAILVGTELVGLTWAAGWAFGGMLGLPRSVSLALELVGASIGLVMVFYFVRAALKVEPIRS